MNTLSNTVTPLRFVGIIPARYASTRFPGKPLVIINGKSMIQRVYEQASKALDAVYVATDDNRIRVAVESFGGKVIMTSDQHKSGTDRCYEAFTKLDAHFDVVINIQGDEPFIQPEQIITLKNCFVNGNTQIATLAKQFSANDSYTTLSNANQPKIVVNKLNEAMYFSRSVIPFVRGENTEDWLMHHNYFKHIGIYAYRADVLAEITQLPISKLEKAESLEQLRWLENGYRIKIGYTNIETIGIDTPEDLAKITESTIF